MADLLTHSIPRSVWHGWGDPAEAHRLPDHAWAYLTERVGAGRLDHPHRPVAIENVVLPETTLAEPVRAALEAVVGTDHVRDDRAARVEHAGGKSFADLVRIRRGDGSHAPDAVVYPGTPAEVQQVLQICAEHRVAVVPFGGGTSVVGGVSALRGPFASVITLDLRRLAAMTALDPVSKVATFQAGMRGPEVEAALRPFGLTLGHYPQSHQEATIGGYVATRSAGQASTGYGRIDEIVLGARLATPEGEMVVGGRSPASAAGPDLLDLVVGSEGALGVITEATLQVADFPAAKRHGTWAFPGFDAAVDALRELAQDLGHGTIPDVCRLSDPDETEVSVTMAGPAGKALVAYLKARRVSTPALAVFVWEGADRGELRRRARRCETVLRRHGAVKLPAAVARTWERGRFSGPYLRDELLDHEVLAETLETATTWADLRTAHGAVRAALHGAFEAAGTPAVVQCHVSHVYPAGASLYFTCIARCAEDPVAQWFAAKSAASAAILASRATITHHHAIGTDHARFLGEEVGTLGLRLLAAAKATLDPRGVLNPGKLIAASDQGAEVESRG